MNQRTRLMVIDDECDLRSALKKTFEHAGYEVFLAESGEVALENLARYRPDLIILDVMMPGMNGWQTLEKIRQQTDVPVLMLTVMGTIPDRVRGLNGGADDYLIKPLEPVELLARIQAQLRRARLTTKSAGKVQVGWVEIDLDNESVNVSGKTTKPPFVAWRILRMLALRRGTIVPTPEMIQAAWFGEPATPQRKRLVKAEIFKLRKILNDTGRPPQLIHAKYRKGYYLEYHPREK